MLSTTKPVTNPVTNNCAGRPMYLPKIHVINIIQSQNAMANRRITMSAIFPLRPVIVTKL